MASAYKCEVCGDLFGGDAMDVDFPDVSIEVKSIEGAWVASRWKVKGELICFYPEGVPYPDLCRLCRERVLKDVVAAVLVKWA